MVEATHLIFTLQFGTIDCSNLNLQSNITTLSLVTCTSNSLTMQANGGVLISDANYWISFSYITHVSTQTNNAGLVIESL